MKSKKWLDGKNIPLWPDEKNIGWVVQTAGRVELDQIYPISGSYNYGPVRTLESGTRAILKNIENGKAYVYNDNGVMMMPVELLEPVGK